MEELTKFEANVRTRYESKFAQDREQLEESFNGKLGQVKQACLEEYEQFKSDLTRRVGLYLESRSEKIDQQLIKQSAIRESAAETKLNNLKAILEGEEHDGISKADLQAAQQQIQDLQNQLGLRTESLRQATARTKQAVDLAEQALKRNRELEVMISEAKRVKAPVLESANRHAKTLSEEAPVPAPSRTRTPRKIEEGTIAKAPVAKPGEAVVPVIPGSPEEIAAVMGE